MTTNRPSMVCSKCQGDMELGLVVDTQGYVGGITGARAPEKVIEWVRGTPKRTWFQLAFSAKGEDRLQVASLRCTRCGYLELYAPDAESAG